MTSTDRVVYSATLYHDSEYDASDDSRGLGYFRTLAAARAAIVKAVDPATGWHTGGIQRGTLHPLDPGVSPEWFESDIEQSWFVGTDGKAAR